MCGLLPKAAESATLTETGARDAASRWALSSAAAPPECRASPRADRACPGRQEWRAALQAGGFNVLVRRQAEHVAQRGLRRRRRDTRARAIGIRRHSAHSIAAAEGAREGLPQRARRQHAAVAERVQSVEHEQRQVAVQRVVLQPVVHQQPAAAHTR